MIDKIFYKHYVFLEQINKLIEENILKFNDINIIINVNNNNKNSLDNEINIINFAKKNKIPFLFKNNIRKCIKYNSDGIFIDSINKETIKSTLFKKDFLNRRNIKTVVLDQGDPKMLKNLGPEPLSENFNFQYLQNYSLQGTGLFLRKNMKGSW